MAEKHSGSAVPPSLEETGMLRAVFERWGPNQWSRTHVRPSVKVCGFGLYVSSGYRSTMVAWVLGDSEGEGR